MAETGSLDMLMETISKPILSSVREMVGEIKDAQTDLQRNLAEQYAEQQKVAILKLFPVQLHIDLAIQSSLEAINLAGLLNPELADNSRRQILVLLTKSSEAMLLESQRQAVANGSSEVIEELARLRDVFLENLQQRLSLIA